MKPSDGRKIMELKVAHQVLKMMTIAVIFLALPLLDTMAMYANGSNSSHRGNSDIVNSSLSTSSNRRSSVLHQSDQMQNGGGYGQNPYAVLKEQSQRESQQANYEYSRPITVHHKSGQMQNGGGYGQSAYQPSDRLKGVTSIEGSSSNKPARSSHHQTTIVPAQSLHHQTTIVPAQSLHHQTTIVPAQSAHHQITIVPARSAHHQTTIVPAQSLHHATVPAQSSQYATSQSLHRALSNQYAATQKNTDRQTRRRTWTKEEESSIKEPEKMASPWKRKMANVGDNTGDVMGVVGGVAGAVPGLLLGPFGLFAGGMVGMGIGKAIGGAIKYVGTGFDPPSDSELWRANQDKMERDNKKNGS